MKNIKDCAVSVNKSMMKLVSCKKSQGQNNATPNTIIKDIDLGSIMLVLSRYLNHNSVQTKVAVLEWIHHLLINFPNEVSLSRIKGNLNRILLLLFSYLLIILQYY